MGTIFRIKTVLRGDFCILTLAGEVDLDVVDDLLQLGRLGLDAVGVKTLVLDLADVTFMDSTGIGALMQLRNTADSHSRSLLLANVPKAVHRILELTALDSMFGVGDSPVPSN